MDVGIMLNYFCDSFDPRMSQDTASNKHLSNGFAVCRQPLLSLCIFELRKWIIVGGMGIVDCSMWIVVGGMWIGDRGW